MAFLKVGDKAVCSPGHNINLDYNRMIDESKYPLALIVAKGPSVAVIMLSEDEIDSIEASIQAYKALKR